MSPLCAKCVSQNDKSVRQNEVESNGVGDADFVHPPLHRGSRRVSYSNPKWPEVGQDSEGEDGRKTGDVGERDRLERFCGKCCNMRDMTLG